MKREYRVRKVGDRYFPEFRYWIFFWNWRRFYFTRENDLYDEALYVINFKTEEEAWDFIREKKGQKKFSSYETRVSI